MLGILVSSLVEGPAESAPATWDARDQLLESLVAAVPKILESQHPDGRWGSPPWVCHDQHNIYPLAAGWSLKKEGNPFYHNTKVLKAIMDGGDALIAEADEKGMWTFRKKDNSTWGQIYMPWTYSRWIRAFYLVKDAMPPDRRARWEQALKLGYEGIAKTCLGSVHNIPAHHAMGLYCAGLAFGREDWKQQAREFMGKVVAAQSPEGYWSEHFGPVVAYNFVYSDSLGIYYALSKDERVLEALRRAAVFHANFTYPDGSAVETVDERNWYHAGVNLGNVGFTFIPEGRGYLARQMSLYLRTAKHLDADYAATMLLYGDSGPATPIAAERDSYTFVLGKGDAMILRRKPWFLCLSAFAGVPSKSRWHQDRQNLVSIYHDGLGLIAGGGNTKLQPYLSTFTVGDPSSLRHQPGDENPNFLPEVDLLWYPTKAALLADESAPGLELTYGEETCALRLRPVSDSQLTVTVESACRTGKRVEAHLPFLRRPGLLLAGGNKPHELTKEPFELTGQELGDNVHYVGVSIAPPAESRLLWPVLLHDPYKKDGRSDYLSGRLVLCVPLSAGRHTADIQLTVGSS